MFTRQGTVGRGAGALTGTGGPASGSFGGVAAGDAAAESSMPVPALVKQPSLRMRERERANSLPDPSAMAFGLADDDEGDPLARDGGAESALVSVAAPAPAPQPPVGRTRARRKSLTEAGLVGDDDGDGSGGGFDAAAGGSSFASGIVGGSRGVVASVRRAAGPSYAYGSGVAGLSEGGGSWRAVLTANGVSGEALASAAGLSLPLEGGRPRRASAV